MPILLAVAASAALVVAGCGGGDEASSASTLSKAEFVKRANAVCRKERAGLAGRIAEFEQRRGGKKPRPYADAVHFVVLPTIESEIWKIESIGTPVGEKERIRVLLAAERSALDSVAVKPRVPSIEAARQPFDRSGRMFRAYGLSSCANGDPPRR